MAEPQNLQDTLDFESIYAGGPAVAGDPASFDIAPWDIGEPQPVVMALEAAGAFTGNVLDIGCGAGENSIFLAGRGHPVTGVDGAAGALGQARQRADERGVRVRFVQDDATTLGELSQEFDSVVDSALYHCLRPDQRGSYAAALHRVTRPGANLRLINFADVPEMSLRIPGVMLREEDLGPYLAQYWDIRSIELVDYVAAFTTKSVTERADVLQATGIRIDVEHLRTDERDRILVPAWHLHAVRR